MEPDQFRVREKKCKREEREGERPGAALGRGARKRSCQGSMYRAESLIAPKALPAKLLSWNVTLLRHPSLPENRVSSTSYHHLENPFAPPMHHASMLRPVRDLLHSLTLSAPYLAASPNSDVCAYRICIYTTPLSFWHFVALENIVTIPGREIKRSLSFASLRTYIKTFSVLYRVLRYS